MLISATKAISNVGFSVLKYLTPALIALFGRVDMQDPPCMIVLDFLLGRMVNPLSNDRLYKHLKDKKF